jgi:hypothetical protein
MPTNATILSGTDSTEGLRGQIYDSNGGAVSEGYGNVSITNSIVGKPDLQTGDVVKVPAPGEELPSYKATELLSRGHGTVNATGDKLRGGYSSGDTGLGGPDDQFEIDVHPSMTGWADTDVYFANEDRKASFFRKDN